MERVRITLTSNKQYDELKQLIAFARKAAEENLKAKSWREITPEDGINYDIIGMCNEITLQAILSKETLGDGE